MELPKLYRVVKITFSTLRTGMGDGWGVIFDCDVLVTKKARRVLCSDGWKWSLVTNYKYRHWDNCDHQDQEILNEYNEVESWD